MMYNPISMAIEDENRLKEKDQREKNKKKRYETRYIFEETVLTESLQENERLDKMALSKVSHMRVAEELNRGFDILTNGGLRGGLAKIEATNFMQKPPKPWDMITPRAGDNEVAANVEVAQKALVDFQATSFDRRSRRLNTNMARAPVTAPLSDLNQKPNAVIQPIQSGSTKP